MGQTGMKTELLKLTNQSINGPDYQKSRQENKLQNSKFLFRLFKFQNLAQIKPKWDF